MMKAEAAEDRDWSTNAPNITDVYSSVLQPIKTVTTICSDYRLLWMEIIAN